MLVLVPTEIEARPLRRLGLSIEIVGFGPVEAALNAYRLLQGRKAPVFLVGLGGAYPGSGLKPGDLALATEEIYGDLAVCQEHLLRDFAPGLPVKKVCPLVHPLAEKAALLLEEAGFDLELGPFVTVSCATRDPFRGEILAFRYSAIVENMEGFAVARVAQEMDLPLIELRAVSNLIEDPGRPWEIDKALKRLGEALRCLRRVF